MKIEPQHIGVGLYQHDLKEKKLALELDGVVEAAVNSVGVDVNVASPALLARVAGLGPSLASKMVEHRDLNGPFATRVRPLIAFLRSAAAAADDDDDDGDDTAGSEDDDGGGGGNGDGDDAIQLNAAAVLCSLPLPLLLPFFLPNSSFVPLIELSWKGAFDLIGVLCMRGSVSEPLKAKKPSSPRLNEHQLTSLTSPCIFLATTRRPCCR